MAQGFLVILIVYAWVGLIAHGGYPNYRRKWVYVALFPIHSVALVEEVQRWINNPRR